MVDETAVTTDTFSPRKRPPRSGSVTTRRQRVIPSDATGRLNLDATDRSDSLHVGEFTQSTDQSVDDRLVVNTLTGNDRFQVFRHPEHGVARAASGTGGTRPATAR